MITDLDGVTYRIRIVGAQLAGWVDDTRNQLAIDAAVHHVTTADPCQQGNNMSFTSDNMTKSAFSMLDMMMNMQRLGLQAVSAYQPLVSAFWIQQVRRNVQHARALMQRAAANRDFASYMIRMRSR